MNANRKAAELWRRYRRYLCGCGETGLTLDVSRMRFTDAQLKKLEPALRRALAEMKALEGGAIANPDENRMVGHYWLRDPQRAPTAEIRKQIEETAAAVKRFARAVHAGKIRPQKARRFTRLLAIGIGGSALGPQFVAAALRDPRRDKLRPYFFDNTDPDGLTLTATEIGDAWRETLTVVVSKSGGTKETRNGMREARAFYERAGLNFAAHAVAVTGAGSALDEQARTKGWLRRFPMWDWIGGRTSVFSAVGLLPAALQGFDTDDFCAGARAMDAATRKNPPRANPAALLAAAWFLAGKGRGEKAMVVLPYKDRLLLFSRYLQQLVMESLGKARDLKGRLVRQGLSVYGNKGSTDQHAFVQQLRDGRNDFFVNFVEVLRDYTPAAGAAAKRRQTAVEPETGSGAFLHGFLHGTRRALTEAGRESLTVTLDALDARRLGALIALYERAVGLYASLVGLNAYHQPGVEAGKKAADAVLKLRERVLARLKTAKGRAFTAARLAKELGAPEEVEAVYHLLVYAAANGELRGVGPRVRRTPGKDPAADLFST